MATDAQQAGVALIIGGGVRLAAGQLRIDAQLVHSRTPGLRKRVSAAGPLGTPLRVIDDLARRLASTLRINSEDRAVSHALSRWPTRKREWLETLGRARDALLGAGHAPSPARAAQLFRRVIAVDKTIAEAHYGLARALSGGAELDRLRLDATARRRSGRDERVSSALEKAIAARPGYHAALFALATLRAATGDHERAADLYGRALAASPDDARALHGMALSQAALKRDGKARRFIDRALRLDGGDADARSTRALLIAVGKGAGHRALPDTSAALTGQGDKARSGLVRAYAQLRAGRAPACLLTITRARRALAPTRRAQYAELVDTLEAVCHLAAGHKAQAKRIVARLAKIKTSAAKYARRLQQPWRRVFADLQRRLGTLR